MIVRAPLLARLSGSALVVLVSVVLAGQTAGPTPAQPPEPVFKTAANYVRVDVFPTVDGQPVADLRQDEFEVLEDKVPQKIDAFQHVAIRGNVPQDTRREPNTVAESRSMMEDPNARVFVVFLDTYHVEVDGSHRIRKPLIDALNRTIGQDDLVGFMTPEMSAGDIAFARKTTTIEGMLTRHWPWGERDRIISVDPIEDQYRQCYPGVPPPPRSGCQPDAGIAREMIYRRRESRTIGALHDLVRFLRGVREERKAVLAVSDGWLLFSPNPNLARPVNCNIPSGPDVSVDPRSGKLTTRPPNVTGTGTSPSDCERDRAALSQIDDKLEFRTILDEANRANTSFYPIDPRGLAVFDEQIVPPIGDSVGTPAATVPLAIDRAQLTARITTLRTLAEATDGLAIVDSNNLDAGLKRVVADLSSYYLLGYYSTGKLDGRFHSISVRVKRPGVQVRARRGFLAATPAELKTTARGARAPTNPEASAAAEHAHALELVLAPLAGYGRDLPLRLLAAAGWKADGTAAVWVVAEAGRGEDWMGGGEASAMLVDGSGATVASSTATIDPGARSVRLTLVPTAQVPPGEYDVRLRVKGAGSTTATSDATRVALAAAPNATGAVFLRRGPTTGNRDVPTADLRFRRSDQLKVEMPAPSAEAGQVSARLLDRTGKHLSAIPVTAATRIDPDGSRWQTAQLSLVPLGSGDYVIELTTAPEDGSGRPGQAGTEQRRTLVAFRVVP
jgi:VWFA-related protein